MSNCYYIYYKSEHGAGVVERVRAMQTELERECGVRGRLLRRHDEITTWMEIYEGIADGPRFEAELDRIVVQHRFQDLLLASGKRHVEHFVEV